jgi:hypothetical protein
MKKIKKGRKKGRTGEKEKLIRNRKFKRKLRIKIKKWSQNKKISFSHKLYKCSNRGKRRGKTYILFINII